jgi:hypothetical protein
MARKRCVARNRRRTPTPLRGAGFLFALFLAGPAGVLHAQVVRGWVLDAESDTPVAGVTVSLVDTLDQVTRTVVSADGDGGFVVAAPAAGTYTLRGQHIGYGVTSSPPFHVPPDDTVRVQFRISAQPIALASLTVIGAPAAPLDPMLEARGFYQRRDDYDGHGKARFFTTEDIDASGAVWTTDLLRDLSELRLVNVGHGRLEVQTRRAGRRVPIFINGTYFRIRRDESYTLDQIIALGQIGAVEVYWRDAPAQYGGGAAIVIWSR